MSGHLQLQLLRLVIVLGLVSGTKAAASWHYPTPGPDGSLQEEDHWGGTCDTGRRQSPIDINSKAAVRGAYPEFDFDGYDDALTGASYINNGHTVQLNRGADSEIAIKGGGLRGKYIFEQMHFHWSSEHTLNGERYGLEAHLVHRHSSYGSVNEAAVQKAGIAVLAVLFRVTDQSNEVIAQILNDTNSIRTEPDRSIPLQSKLELEDLLPKNRDRYFRYEGSLTTPVCAESVVWTVFPETVPISLDQVEQFKTFRDDENHELILNYRPVKPLNLRVLVLVDDVDPLEASTGAAPRSFPTAISLLSMLPLVGRLLFAHKIQ
ncbi:putative carbonic anhydrase 3 isoform X2 [Uranotaenia lowii]|uniref:putative carbonic anhydrase 3 isoform X2 n=1 Tax=Uranotaenia lowii TaxID=190385 RepID=UPI00247900D2|nr:putative carbonic anhydrase 3 isoform X2 [Uranotaenia lowii]